jgi:hypothetical protein
MTPQLTMFNTMSLGAIMPGLLIKACVFSPIYFFILTLVPGLPHSADNIQWVCFRVNLGKSQFSDKEFRVWAKAAFTWSGQPRSLQDISFNVAGQEDIEEEDEKAEEWGEGTIGRCVCTE